MLNYQHRHTKSTKGGARLKLLVAEKFNREQLKPRVWTEHPEPVAKRGTNLNHPVIEPERDVFFTPTSAQDETNAQLALYPLSFRTFGNHGATWSPRELTDEQLVDQVANLTERLAVYGTTGGESVAKIDLREQLSACIQEKQKRCAVRPGGPV